MQEFFERMKEGAGLWSDPDSGRLGRRPGEEVPTAAPGWVGFNQARGVIYFVEFCINILQPILIPRLET